MHKMYYQHATLNHLYLQYFTLTQSKSSVILKYCMTTPYKQLALAVPVVFCIISKAVMAPLANRGGNDAEKQYPSPDSLYNTQPYELMTYIMAALFYSMTI